MDKTRNEDLDNLKSVFEDMSIPYSTRKVAYKSYVNILKQLQDTKLTDMRHRLVRAIRANDIDFVENMEMRIQEYSLRKGYVPGR